MYNIPTYLHTEEPTLDASVNSKYSTLCQVHKRANGNVEEGKSTDPFTLCIEPQILYTIPKMVLGQALKKRSYKKVKSKLKVKEIQCGLIFLKQYIKIQDYIKI